MKRDIRLSNLKGLLIFLVVFGHIMELNREQLHELYVYIYSFHMPLFIFISGYLSKNMRMSKIINLVLLYLLFQTFFNCYLYFLGEYHTIPFHYGIPQFHLWYIVSLSCWYIIVWILNQLNINNLWKWILYITIFILCFFSRWYLQSIVDLINNYYEGFNSLTISYQRTLTFLPFFLAGFFINKHVLNRLYHVVSNEKIYVFFLSITSMLLFLFIQSYPKMENLFWGSFGSVSFLNQHSNITSYILFVSIHYFIAFGLCFLLINLINNKVTILTKFGDHSLAIFLFHPVFVFYFWKLEFYHNWNMDTKLLLFFLVSLLVTFILSTNMFVKATRYLCNPYMIVTRLIKIQSRNK